MNGVEYKKYDISYEKEVLRVFTESFENYPLFYGIFKDCFKTEKAFNSFYRCLMKTIFKATSRKDTCYVGFKDGRVVSVVIVEAPDDKPIGVWDYTVCGMAGVIMKLGLKNTFKFMDLSDETEVVVRNIKEPHFLLYFLAVDPKCQGEGIGTGAIQDFLIPLVKEKGSNLLTVTTNTEKNVKFYLDNGFSLVKEEALKYYEKPVDNWTFRMEL